MSDIVHVRRADGRDLDCMLHVNPRRQRKGVATVFSPSTTAWSGRPCSRSTTRGSRARHASEERDAEQRVRVPVAVEAHGVTWLVIK